MHGGDQIAEVLHQHGVQFLFTLCGGHISPILVGAKSVEFALSTRGMRSLPYSPPMLWRD